MEKTTKPTGNEFRQGIDGIPGSSFSLGLTQDEMNEDVEARTSENKE